MGKYYERLKTGNPDRQVSSQELMNVLGEYFQESAQEIRAALMEKQDKPRPAPKPKLAQRLMRTIRRIGRRQNAKNKGLGA